MKCPLVHSHDSWLNSCPTDLCWKIFFKNAKLEKRRVKGCPVSYSRHCVPWTEAHSCYQATVLLCIKPVYAVYTCN